jgi:hypothetical protein
LGELKKMPALSFDDDFRAMGLTTISWKFWSQGQIEIISSFL